MKKNILFNIIWRTIAMIFILYVAPILGHRDNFLPWSIGLTIIGIIIIACLAIAESKK